ncbi:WXG100 family type VII secretion target [Mycobacterium kyorinense]|uniref:ESAT-6-like protein n=1 Tax=Mycobacterium kyorinense TaxID=487514 RepID=A0A1X1Y0B1_9MYCO|nr:WXG100 family type VII secretion target [Mycobacterium kyorinense]ORW04562.1 hypothetical protein AWC14_02995 [Mycobacterium kyorinense]
MPEPLSVNTDAPFNAAHTVANHAVELHEELDRLRNGWENLSHSWIGVAASAYRPKWDQWHEGASKLTEMLKDSADKLARAAVLYESGDDDAAQALDSAGL